ncbi:MAG: tRNA (adenosine(37)-N6)-dimethylallyltransferase MiaA [Planctomycetota bacterium]
MNKPLPIILILGPTASGKSALAARLAQALPGEVISADAFAVYRGMDIGTAKPSAEERAVVPHYLIDCFEPEDRCDANRWFALADGLIREIHTRKKTPVIAGGTPLYTKLLIEGISAGPPRDVLVRSALQAAYQADPAAVWTELQRIDPTYAATRHPNDERRIIRALEVYRLTGKSYSSFHTTDGTRRADLRPLMIGLEWDRAVLHQRIAERTRTMFARSLIDEVRKIRPRLSPEAMQAVGYKEVCSHLDGTITLEQCIADVTAGTRQLAKHQLTWYRRFPDIRWLPGDAPDLFEQALALCTTHLA